MTYDLLIIPSHGLSPVLRAQIECPHGEHARVIAAEIDQETDGQLSRDGANAFRCLALAEISIALALEDQKKTASPSPFHSYE